MGLDRGGNKGVGAVSDRDIDLRSVFYMVW